MAFLYASLLVLGLLLLFLASKALKAAWTGTPPRIWNMDVGEHIGGFGSRLGAALAGGLCLAIALLLILASLPLIAFMGVGEFVHP